MELKAFGMRGFVQSLGSPPSVTGAPAEQISLKKTISSKNNSMMASDGSYQVTLP